MPQHYASATQLSGINWGTPTPRLGLSPGRALPPGCLTDSKQPGCVPVTGAGHLVAPVPPPPAQVNNFGAGKHKAVIVRMGQTSLWDKHPCQSREKEM